MQRIGTTSLTMLCACLLATAISSAAFATPVPNSVQINQRIFNDCPISTLNVTNGYPGSIVFDETWDQDCVGFANRHNWRFSTDGGGSAAVFGNANDFAYSAIVTI